MAFSSTTSAEWLNIWVKQGADKTLPLGWAPGGVLADFTGCTARMGVRVSPGSTVIVSISTTPNAQGSIVLGAGTVTVTITKAATLALTGTKYVYDLIVDAADNTSWPLFEGIVTSEPMITP